MRLCAPTSGPGEDCVISTVRVPHTATTNHQRSCAPVARRDGHRSSWWRQRPPAADADLAADASEASGAPASDNEGREGEKSAEGGGDNSSKRFTITWTAEAHKVLLDAALFVG
eukprot:jgi/Tetstr1/436710/TSEL_025493.t1